MPLLANIFTAAGNAAFAEDEKSIALPNAGQAGAESFDDVMSRALLPPEANVAAAQNRRLRPDIAGAQKRNPVDSSQPPAPVKAGKDSPADPADLLATVKINAGAKADDQHGKPADPLAQTGDGVVADALPNPAIPLPAPALPAWVLNLSAPAAPTKSAANSPVAAAVLPFGRAGKSIAAPMKNPPSPKPDSQTGGLSAAAPELSVPAGTEAGDSVPQKIDVVPPGAAQPDNFIVLQNPALESAANSPVAAAVLPFGVAEKSVAAPVKNPSAPKTESQTGGLPSAAAPKLSVPAGTEAGDSVQQKIDVVPPGAAQPDNYIVLQNPVTESAANNLVAAAVLPFGVAEKSVAAPVKNPSAPKTESQTGGLSAAAPELSVPAGTETGDSAPQKIASVPPGAAQPDNFIVLQNPMTESAANNLVAAAVLPFGVAEISIASPVKNPPAPKTELQTSGLPSAAAPELSVPAGTEAGDSVQQKIDVVPPGAAQPDNSIVLQNPAPESAANNPVVAAVLPFGMAGKSVASPVKNPSSPKTESQTGGLPSAVAPELSVPAGTEAGDSMQQKIDVVPPGAAQPDNSIVLQNPAPESAAPAPVKSHGTAVAKQDVPMKNTEQTNKVAGQAEKVLPGNAVSAASEKVLPGRSVFAPAPARGERLEANAVNLTVSPDRATGGTTPPDELAAVANVSDHAARALECMHDLMAWHATRLVGANSDSLQVVIKPDAGTQLSLQLRQHGGGIEAQAVLQKGDFENLKQHWPELQQRLEQRGIKLAPLTSDENSAAGSGSQGHQNQRNHPAEREPLFAGAVAGFGLARGMAVVPDKPVVHAATPGSWQMWA